jgi:carbon monoxide dehydrogenase subunit G
MKKTTAVVAIVILAWAGLAGAHGPSRQKVTESIDIDAKPEAVWEQVKDFGNLGWVPAVASTTSDGGNAKGAVRVVTLKKGGVLKEELKNYDAAKRTYQYRITEVDVKTFPVNNYSSTISVQPNQAGGTKVEWSGAFYRGYPNNDPPPELSDEAAIQAVTTWYKEGLANLKSMVEAKK